MVVTKEMPTLPPMLRARFIRPEAGIVLLARQVGVGRRIDGHEKECQTHRLDHARPCHGCKVHVEIETRHVEQRERKHAQAEDHQPPRVGPREQETDQRHEQHDGEAAGRDRHTGPFGGVAEQGLHEQGQQQRAAQQREAEHEHHEVGRGEGAVLEQVKVDDRVLVTPLPEGDEHERGRAYRR